MSTESAPIAQSPVPASFRPCPTLGRGVVTTEQCYALTRASLIVGDGLLLAASVYFVYLSSLPFMNPVRGVSIAGVVGIWMALLHINGLYNPKLRRPPHQLAYDLVKTAGMAILAGSAVFFLAPSLSVPREVHWNSALLAGLLLLLWRLAHVKLFPAQQVRKRALFLGASADGVQIAEEMQGYPESGYEVVGFLDGEPASSHRTSPLRLGDEVNLSQIVQRHRIDSIILPVAERVSDGTLKALADCSELGCELISTSRLYERASGRVPVQHITHEWFITELDNSNRAAYRIGKRMMDVGLSIAGLMATGLLFPLIAVLIKLDSPGPIFYSQIRAGKNGRPFKIYKFRSMVHNAEANGAVWAKVNDKRITKLGEFLRKTRLDELPQLYNVLLGEMSLVGPRPERPEFVEQLAKEIPFFSKRLLLLPGLTGWAQVNYPYGSSTRDALEKLQYDLYYIKNRSMFLDLEIVLRTVSVVLNRQGR